MKIGYAAVLAQACNLGPTWNTVYMAAVIDRLRAEGKSVTEEDIARIKQAM